MKYRDARRQRREAKYRLNPNMVDVLTHMTVKEVELAVEAWNDKHYRSWRTNTNIALTVGTLPFANAREMRDRLEYHARNLRSWAEEDIWDDEEDDEANPNSAALHRLHANKCETIMRKIRRFTRVRFEDADNDGSSSESE